MRQAIFLDRDGVINRSVVRNGKPYPPNTIEEFEFLPGVHEGVGNLKGAGFCIIVVTNQPDVATGKAALQVVESMHQLVLDTLKVDAIKVCYHVDEDGCACRKPKPGMLLDSAKEWSLDLSRSFMIGDRWRDIEAGIAAGCQTILVGDGYSGERKIPGDFCVGSLLEASQVILGGLSRS